MAEFASLPLRDEPRRPRVGLVGEILVKFQPDANNDAVRVIESEGCEAALPGLLEFFLMNMTSAQWRLDNLGIGSRRSVRLQQGLVWLIEQYQRPAVRALRRANDTSRAEGLSFRSPIRSPSSRSGPSRSSRWAPRRARVGCSWPR